jgi:cation:H+ antiporter
MMVWIKFFATAIGIVIAANYLAKYGDVIAIRTRLGGMFVGVLLMAGATSLPEVLTSISAVNQQQPGIAAGNLLGSNSFNMLLLAILDLTHRNQRLLRKAARRHALSGSLAILMIVLVLYFMLADIQLKIGWVGIDSLIIIAVYVLAVRLISRDDLVAAPSREEIPPETAKLWVGLLGFFAAATVLIVVTPIMVSSATEIADITGLGTTFVGTTLVALVTSLPELVTTIAAIRIGASDMAIGNLFGSNMFNMAALGLTDFFYTSGRFLPAIDPAFLLVGMLGLLMTIVGLVGNLARLERRVWFIEVDSLALFVIYISGMILLFQKGIG